MSKKVVIAPEGKQQRVEIAEQGEVLEKNLKHEHALIRSDLRKKFVTVGEQIAESTVYSRNWKFPKADQHYPYDPDARFVTKYFPYAKGGPLLVDEPQTEREMLKAYDRQVILRKLGYRHIVVWGKSDLYECLEQLGEV